MVTRCDWANRSKEEAEYHDTEWGVPSYDDAYLFEMLVLESMLAGLSWTTIMAKRKTMREAFANFDPVSIATFNHDDIASLLTNPGIIRHQKKIEATISNARVFLDIQSEFQSFSNYLWAFVDHEPIVNSYHDISMVPSQTPLAQQIAKDFKVRGFKFFGPTTVYAYMQAVGLVNDHVASCFKKHTE